MTAHPVRIGWLAALAMTVALLAFSPDQSPAATNSGVAPVTVSGALAPGASRDLRAPIAERRTHVGPSSRPTVLLAQRLFRQLGYPLGSDRPGELGVATRGALQYFQRKYGLAATGYPDAGTLSMMASVEASLRAPSYGSPAPAAPVSAVTPPAGRGADAAQAQPRDLVERVLGTRLPLLAVALALAGLLSLLALSGRLASGYRSTRTRDSTVSASGGD
ncbi:MAG: peptidoglycan-binding domain-containing protein [Solirubrobacteraceae bacterium]